MGKPKKIDIYLGEVRECDTAGMFRTAGQTYTEGEKILVANQPEFYLVCTTAGKAGSGNIEIPENAVSGTTTVQDGSIVWTVYRYRTGTAETPFVYGMDYDTAIATAATACKRVVLDDSGSYVYVDNFSQMPAHNLRRCIMSNLATREIAYYLHPADSNYKEDGTAADLTGGDGDIMVEIPVAYWRIDHYTDASGHAHIVYLISDKQFTNSVPHDFFYVSPGGKTLRTQYVGACVSVICDANGAPLTTNIDATGSAGYSEGRKARSVFGAKPYTGMTQATHRAAAANNGGYGINSLFKQYLALLMYIEGCSFDTQTTISHGFLYASAWNYAFTRLTGRTACFGNGTGSIHPDADIDSAITWQDVSDAQKVVAFSYRGIENPYGEVWEFEDGAVADVLNGYLYHTADCSIYSDSNYLTTYLKTAHTWPTSSGYPKTWDERTFFALTNGGGSNTYLCDYFYPTNNTARVVLRGGHVHNGAIGGAGCVYVIHALAYAYAYIGGRLAA